MADETQETRERGPGSWLMEGIMPGGGMVKQLPKPTGPGELTRGIKVIDCDTHLSEKPDLYTSRVPAKWKDRVPHVKRVGELDLWAIGDDMLGPFGPAVIDRDRNKLLGKLSLPNTDQMDPGAWDIATRLEYMDSVGVHAQICYPNGGGFTSYPLLKKYGDDDFAISMVRLYNDAKAEAQVESGNRLFPVVALPTWDRDVMANEARRCIEDLGLVGFNLPDRPEQTGLPGFLSDHWAPLFELCDAHKVPINFHIASGIDGFEFTWQDFPFETKMAIGSMLFYIGNAATLANFLMSGLFDKYPNLRIVSVESGLGWIPFVLEALEYQLDEMMPNDRKRLKRRPKEYFADHVWACYWFEERGPRDWLDIIGVNKVLFETDYPHPTSLYPGVQEKIAATLGGHDAATRKRILQDNAVELYHLPI